MQFTGGYPTLPPTVTSSYIGNGTAARTIPSGLPSKPKFWIAFQMSGGGDVLPKIDSMPGNLGPGGLTGITFNDSGDVIIDGAAAAAFNLIGVLYCTLALP